MTVGMVKFVVSWVLFGNYLIRTVYNEGASTEGYAWGGVTLRRDKTEVSRGGTGRKW